MVMAAVEDSSLQADFQLACSEDQWPLYAIPQVKVCS